MIFFLICIKEIKCLQCPIFSKKYDIKTVIIFGYHPQQKLSSANYHIYDIEDVPSSTETMLSIMPNLIKIIDKSIKEKKKVLITCQAGRSRSITALALYLHHCCQETNNNKSMENILKFIYTRKTKILASYDELLMGINKGFSKMLLSQTN